MSLIEKKKIQWQCRRGMLELDLIFREFMDNGFDQLSSEQVSCFKKLLACQDDQLFSWFMNYERCSDQELQSMIDLILGK